jgi:hypothetical protein
MIPKGSLELSSDFMSFVVEMKHLYLKMSDTLSIIMKIPCQVANANLSYSLAASRTKEINQKMPTLSRYPFRSCSVVLASPTLPAWKVARSGEASEDLRSRA